MPVSPELLRRIDALNGCQGYWLLIRDGEPEPDCSYYWHHSPDAHLAECLAQRWRGVSLGFVPRYCGYSDYGDTGLAGLANYKVLTDPGSTPDPNGRILKTGYGHNGSGVVIDVLTVTDDILKTIQALESYPLISEDEYSHLECFGVGKLWADESVLQRVRMLQDLGLCIFSARRDGAPWEDGNQELYESLISTLNEYPTIAED